MLTRTLRRTAVARLRQFPAIAIVGPRQCGKTTLARSVGGAYYDLEQESERLRLDLELENLAEGSKLVILDEAQAWPPVFARLRGLIDKDRRRNGRFLLLGSVSPALMTQVSESLAGRLSVLELAPLGHQELPTKAARARAWLCGGYPDGGVLRAAAYPQWQIDYLNLLAQRDLPMWGLPAGPQTISRLMRMLASLHGQPWNASQVGQSMGLSYHTVNSYLDFLAGAFLIRSLPAWQANIRKRLVKAPRVYWRDSGLLHALLDVGTERELLARPWVGASWEGHIIEELLREAMSRGITATPYYFRTSDQQEIDLVLDLGRERWAIEIKLTATPASEDMRRLDRTADLIGADRRFLVSRTSESVGDAYRASHNLPSILRELRRAHATRQQR